MGKIFGKEPYKLNLGAGNSAVHFPEFINIDIKPLSGIDLIWDISRGLPFPDDSVEYIGAHDFLEHVDNLKFVLQEMYRVSRHKAIWNIRVPYWANYTSVNTLTHKSFFCENTFAYFDPSQRKDPSSGMHEWGWNIWIRCIEGPNFNYHSRAVEDIGPQGSKELEWAKQYYVNVVDTIAWKFEVIKEFPS